MHLRSVWGGHAVSGRCDGWSRTTSLPFATEISAWCDEHLRGCCHHRANPCPAEA